jgi:hypothetical protein
LGITYGSRSFTNVTSLAPGESANCTVRQKVMQSDFNSWDEFGQAFMVELRVDAMAADATDAPVVYYYVNTTVPLESWPGLSVVDAMAAPSTVIEAGGLAG